MKKKGVDIKLNSFKLIFLFFLFPIIFAAFSLVSFGELLTGNFTINTTTKFNFTSNLTGVSGYIQYGADVNSNNSIEPINNAKMMFLGLGSSEQDFIDNFKHVPFKNFSDFTGGSYSDDRHFVIPNGIYGIIVPNSSGASDSDQYLYGAIYIVERNIGINITFQSKFINKSGNNTFIELTGTCESHGDFQSCLADFANDCDWNDQTGSCSKFFGFSDIPHVDCDIIPEFACNGINDTFCIWDPSLGTQGSCDFGSNFDPNIGGFNCSAIINDTVCTNQSFTEKTGLCTWNASSSPPRCNLNKTKTFEDLPNPPYFSCQAAAVVNNRTACENLADNYFMPCGFNNATDRCEELFFDFGKFNDFEDIGSENTCQLMGGTWKSETAFDPINNKVTIESWCEFSVSIKLFSSIKPGGEAFGGSSSQLRDCSRDCFACEFQSNGSLWSTQPVAKSQCEVSAAGCSFRADGNAFNGLGWCNPAAGFGFDCDSFCGDCNLMPNVTKSCQDSAAGCKFDNVTQFCIGKGQKGCNQECMQCFDQTSCESSSASTGCEFDTDGNFCKPKGGSFEICFDGVDNDNNGKTDCADFKCSSDVFCAGSIGDTNNCFQFESFTYESFGGTNHAQNNCTATTGCYWITEDFGFDNFGSGYCAPEFEQCFINDSLALSQSDCEGFGGGDVCVFEAETRCHENSTMENDCFNVGGGGNSV